MISRISALAFLGLLVFISGCVWGVERPIAIDDGMRLDDDGLGELQIAGAKGDPDAAFRLSLHYSAGGNAASAGARRWRLIAAENGHPVAQYTIWFRDHKSSDPIEKARAWFWLERSATAGYPRAVQVLEEQQLEMLNNNF